MSSMKWPTDGKQEFLDFNKQFSISIISCEMTYEKDVYKLSLFFLKHSFLVIIYIKEIE